MYSSGYCLLHGHGTGRDLGAGLRWLRRAAEQGDGDACQELGQHYLRTAEASSRWRSALRWLRAGARAGHAGCIQALRNLDSGSARS